MDGSFILFDLTRLQPARLPCGRLIPDIVASVRACTDFRRNLPSAPAPGVHSERTTVVARGFRMRLPRLARLTILDDKDTASRPVT